MDRRFFLLALTPLAAGCRAGKERKFDYGEPKQKYAVRGVVLRLRPESRVAVLKHEKIEGWMEPMTMEFPVPSAGEFASLKEGATIRATVNVNDMYFWLTAITVE
ncbi:MAG: copper-binding protein [Candidatus Solibacter usitatus]|nr:copper-binding protein [Candidatus Solibacter usitatus]